MTAHVCRTSENCKLLILQDKRNIEIFLSPDATDVSGRAATFTCVNGTASCFCNKCLQN